MGLGSCEEAKEAAEIALDTLHDDARAIWALYLEIREGMNAGNHQANVE